jgi:hemoglobin-like flavoprotein
MSLNTQLVRKSFQSLGVSEDEIVSRFYQLLFETYPEMKRLLPALAAGNLERATARAFRLILEHLDDPDELSRELAPYARSLRQNGVRNVHFAALGETWLRTIAVVRKDLWTGELSREWALAYQRAALALRRPARIPEQREVG